MAIDWLKYANQGAIRNDPLSSRLVQALSFLPDMGVTMDVFSGGQEAEGPNRTGSHRHDHGNAADVFFYKDGRQLDWANPKDRPIFEQIVERAHSNGVTGFGAGPGYMRPGSMHIGFGTPAVWGAGGRGSNAPGWLREAFNNAASSATPVAAPSPTPAAPPLSPPVDVASLPVHSVMGSIAPQATEVAPQPTAQPKEAPSPIGSILSQLGSGEGRSSSASPDLLALLGSMAPQQPQFSPVQIMGPSPEQATALSSLVAALKNRMV